MFIERKKRSGDREKREEEKEEEVEGKVWKEGKVEREREEREGAVGAVTEAGDILLFDSETFEVLFHTNHCKFSHIHTTHIYSSETHNSHTTHTHATYIHIFKVVDTSYGERDGVVRCAVAVDVPTLSQVRHASLEK